MQKLFFPDYTFDKMWKKKCDHKPGGIMMRVSDPKRREMGVCEAREFVLQEFKCSTFAANDHFVISFNETADQINIPACMA